MPRMSKSQDKPIPVSASKTAKKSDSARQQSNADSESKENSKLNVEEIVKRYSTHSEKEEQLSEECLAEMSAMEESFKELESFELQVEPININSKVENEAEVKTVISEEQKEAKESNEKNDIQPSGQMISNSPVTKQNIATSPISTLKSQENPAKKRGRPSGTKGKVDEAETSVVEKKPRRSTRLHTK